MIYYRALVSNTIVPPILDSFFPLVVSLCESPTTGMLQSARQHNSRMSANMRKSEKKNIILKWNFVIFMGVKYFPNQWN